MKLGIMDFLNNLIKILNVNEGKPLATAAER